MELLEIVATTASIFSAAGFIRWIFRLIFPRSPDQYRTESRVFVTEISRSKRSRRLTVKLPFVCFEDNEESETVSISCRLSKEED